MTLLPSTVGKLMGVMLTIPWTFCMSSGLNSNILICNAMQAAANQPVFVGFIYLLHNDNLRL